MISRTVPGFPNYFAGLDGRIWSLPREGSSKRGLFLNAHQGNLVGHRFVVLYKEGKVVSLWVHRIILETFVGKRPDGMECRHLNGISDDNRLENLKWGTPKENAQDKIKHGTTVRGEKSKKSKLTEDQVKWIYYSYLSPDGWTQKALADYYNVDQSTVSLIINKKNWKHLWR